MLFCLGASHKTAPIQIREKLYIPGEDIKKSLPNILNDFAINELLALSTCNRFEMIGVIDSQNPKIKETLIEAMIKLHKGIDENDLNMKDLYDGTYLLTNHDVIKHAFNVASSLDSLVVGETQITGQFKDAINLAKEAGTLGPILDRLGQESLATAKKVRSQTDISKRPVSISHAAVDLAGRVYGDLGDCSFLVIGAGEMSELAARYALKYNPKRLMICNRNLENAQKLCDTLAAGEAFAFRDLDYCLAESNIVISSTAAPNIVLSKNMIQNAIKTRRNRSIFLIDIALPRDIDPDASSLEDVYLFDIDDLKQIVDEHKEHRQKAANDAISIIESSVSGFENWLSTLSIKPLIASYNNYLQDLISNETQKSLSKEIFSGLLPVQKQAIQNMQDAIIGKLTAELSKNLKSANDSDTLNLLKAIDTLIPNKKKKHD